MRVFPNDKKAVGKKEGSGEEKLISDAYSSHLSRSPYRP